MSNTTKALTEQARALPPQDRIALVEDVLDSLDRADPISTNCGCGRRVIV
jgi:Putative addiction module component